MTETKTPPAKPPQGQMLDLIVGYWVSCGVHVASRLAIADHLAKEPRTIPELAKASGTHAPTLHRLLRMLASSGVFRERPDGRFENTPLSETLRSTVPASMRPFAIMMVDSYNVAAWQGLLECVKTGEPAFEKVHEKPIFEYFADHPKEAREFGESMTSLSGSEADAIAAALDPAGIEKLVDVGGGYGSLMAAILRRHPALRGVVYDRPETIENARRDVHAREQDIAERLELVAGDFFETVPAGADACIMKYILHDWTDELSIQILTNCREAMGSKGKLFAVDNVIPPGNEPQWGKLLDINMLVLTGGRERTKDDFVRIFAAAGFRLIRVIPTACPLSIVEGAAV